MRYCQPLVEIIGQSRGYSEILSTVGREVIGQSRGYSEIMPTSGRGYRTE